MEQNMKHCFSQAKLYIKSFRNCLTLFFYCYNINFRSNLNLFMEQNVKTILLLSKTFTLTVLIALEMAFPCCFSVMTSTTKLQVEESFYIQENIQEDLGKVRSCHDRTPFGQSYKTLQNRNLVIFQSVQLQSSK